MDFDRVLNPQDPTEDYLPADFSWGTKFEDFDNNGLLDLFVAGGRERDHFLYMQTAPGDFDEVAEDYGIVKSWADYSAHCSEDQPEEINSRTAVTADYDQDGFMDLLIISIWRRTCCDPDPDPDPGESACAGKTQFIIKPRPDLFHNNFGEILDEGEGNSIGFRLIGDPDLDLGSHPYLSTRDAIGARVTVIADLDGTGPDGDTCQIREVVSGSSNAASTSSLELEFGIHKATEADVIIQWPSGLVMRGTFDAQTAIHEVEEILGDLNADGVVDSDDCIIMADIISGSGECQLACLVDPEFCWGDLNFDGDVDGDDLAIVAGITGCP